MRNRLRPERSWQGDPQQAVAEPQPESEALRTRGVNSECPSPSPEGGKEWRPSSTTARSPDPALSSRPGRQRAGEVLRPPSADSKANLMGHSFTDTPRVTFNQTHTLLLVLRAPSVDCQTPTQRWACFQAFPSRSVVCYRINIMAHYRGLPRGRWW